jgi:hypothetical protein
MTGPAQDSRIESDDKPKPRVDAQGRAFKGSQLQVQIYVNRREHELEQKLREELEALDQKAERFEWVSPLEVERFVEYQDVAFLRAVGLERLAPELAAFWPARGGPVWDGLARAHLRTGGEGVLLLEGKSYPKELFGPGCTAKANRSKQLIRSALEQTQAWLGLPVGADRWLGRLYQSANRLAHLYFLREIVGIEAWLAHACFIDDTDHVPIAEGAWRRSMEEADRELGLAESSPFAGAVFLAARPRTELVGTGGH